MFIHWRNTYFYELIGVHIQGLYLVNDITVHDILLLVVERKRTTVTSVGARLQTDAGVDTPS